MKQITITMDDDILDLPRKTPNDGWITDRDPDEDGDYWTTIDVGNKDLGGFVERDWYSKRGGWSGCRRIVNAWKPFIKPEPYKPCVENYD
jgi:hypothetical protein